MQQKPSIVKDGATGTVCLVGLGNVGSKTALQLPLVGVDRLALIDHDRVDCERNGHSCSIYADRRLAGRFKVEVLAGEIRRRFPRCEVIPFPQRLEFVGLAGLRDLTPAIWIGAVDSRLARYELARVTMTLGQPLVDLAIGAGAYEFAARVRTTWTKLDGIHPLAVWSSRDFRLLQERRACDGLSDQIGGADRPISSPVAGTLAAALALPQLRKLWAGDETDIGWETRIDLGNCSLIRCRLPRSDDTHPFLPDHGCVGESGPRVVVRSRTLADLLAEAEARLGCNAEVVLNRLVSPAFFCIRCEQHNEEPGPIDGQRCAHCGESMRATLPLGGLIRDSLGPLAGASLDCLGTDDDILLALSSDGSEQVWLEYRMDKAEESRTQ